MELPQIRKRLDEIDSEIIKLVTERQSYMPAVAQYKLTHNLPQYDKAREDEIFASKYKLAQELGGDPELTKKILEAIIENSHQIQKKVMEK